MPYTDEERRVYQVAYYRKRIGKLFTILGGVCVDCGTKYNLEFDHINPKTKSFNVSTAARSKKWELVVVEAKKCKLRCKSCHIKRTTRLRSLAYKTKTKPKHSKSPHAKLTDSEVRSIRKLAKLGMSHRELSRRFNISKICIFKVIHRDTYKSVV